MKRWALVPPEWRWPFGANSRGQFVKDWRLQRDGVTLARFEPEAPLSEAQAVVDALNTAEAVGR